MIHNISHGTSQCPTGLPPFLRRQGIPSPCPPKVGKKWIENSPWKLASWLSSGQGFEDFEDVEVQGEDYTVPESTGHCWGDVENL